MSIMKIGDKIQICVMLPVRGKPGVVPPVYGFTIGQWAGATVINNLIGGFIAEIDEAKSVTVWRYLRHEGETWRHK